MPISILDLNILNVKINVESSVLNRKGGSDFPQKAAICQQIKNRMKTYP